MLSMGPAPTVALEPSSNREQIVSVPPWTQFEERKPQTLVRLDGSLSHTEECCDLDLTMQPLL